jgi:hypothetical protein
VEPDCSARRSLKVLEPRSRTAARRGGQGTRKLKRIAEGWAIRRAGRRLIGGSSCEEVRAGA